MEKKRYRSNYTRGWLNARIQKMPTLVKQVEIVQTLKISERTLRYWRMRQEFLDSGIVLETNDGIFFDTARLRLFLIANGAIRPPRELARELKKARRIESNQAPWAARNPPHPAQSEFPTREEAAAALGLTLDQIQ